jgi:hypothetical protein
MQTDLKPQTACTASARTHLAALFGERTRTALHLGAPRLAASYAFLWRPDLRDGRIIGRINSAEPWGVS